MKKTRSIFFFIIIGAICVVPAIYSETGKILSMTELRKKGVVMQSHEYSCGAASLATIANILGLNVSEKDVFNVLSDEKVVTERDKEGNLKIHSLSLAHLEKAATRLGLNSISLKGIENGSLAEIVEELKPVIMRIKLYGKKLHFVIVQDMDCLLYTSPSPRDLSTSRMPSSA